MGNKSNEPLLNKPLKWIFGLCAGVLLMPVAITVATQVFPGMVSEPIEDVLEKNGINKTFLDEIDHNDIRVYDRDSFLTAFHFAGLYLNNEKDMIMRFEKANKIEQMGMLASLYVLEFYPALDAGLTVLQQSNNAEHTAYALVRASDNGVEKPCFIYGPDKQASVPKTFSTLTSIPENDLRDLNGHEALYYSYTLRHEASHCDFLSETGADDLAISTIKNELPDSDIDKLIKYRRAVAAFSFPDRDLTDENSDYLSYAIALKLEQAEKNPMYFPGIVEHANKAIYKLIQKHIQPQDGEEYYLSVYRTLKDLLEQRKVYGMEARRVAELYVEGVEYLVPSVLLEAPVVSQPADNLSAFNPS